MGLFSAKWMCLNWTMQSRRGSSPLVSDTHLYMNPNNPLLWEKWKIRTVCQAWVSHYSQKWQKSSFLMLQVTLMILNNSSRYLGSSYFCRQEQLQQNAIVGYAERRWPFIWCLIRFLNYLIQTVYREFIFKGAVPKARTSRQSVHLLMNNF